MGKFKVVVGVMGSSKSTRAITDVSNLRYQGLRVLVVKPKSDDRDGDKISSRLITDTIKADEIWNTDYEINVAKMASEKYDYIIVDEFHMMSLNQIEDLYKISAITKTNINLYGLSMSWKGKPFETSAYAMAYADEIEKINIINSENQLLTHHIKRNGSMPCMIDCDGGYIETGDIENDKYTTVSKETFYTIYGILGQI